MKKQKLVLDQINVQSFIPRDGLQVVGAGSLVSCESPQGCGDTFESCIPEKCMAGATQAGEPGC